MKVYHPQIEIKLTKLITRSKRSEGVGLAQSRYQAAVFDLTKFLCQTSQVVISKSVREPTGAFSISIPDRPEQKLSESIYGLIEPMDLVEIRMARTIPRSIRTGCRS